MFNLLKRKKEKSRVEMQSSVKPMNFPHVFLYSGQILMWIYIFHSIKSGIIYNLDTHTWYVIICADSFLQKSIANFPGKYAWTFAFVHGYFLYNFLCGNSRFRSTNSTWPYTTGFIVSAIMKNQSNESRTME